MAIREGRWDCVQCGTVGNGGQAKVCPSCGHPRPENVRFYLPEDAKKVEDKALIQKAKAGADWICDYCGASNHADKKSCKQCYAPRDGNRTQEVKEYKPDAVPRTGDEADQAPDVEGGLGVVSTADQTEQAAKTGSSTTGWLLFLALLFLCLCGSYFLYFRSEDANSTVTGFEWERTIQVEEEKTLIEEDWEIPTDGRHISEEEAIRRYDQVLLRNETRTREVSEQVQVGTRSVVCGQRDLGNGFFEDIKCDEPVYETQTRTETYQEPIYEDVPVYDTKYTYEIDRWVDGRLEKETGTTQNPEWPIVYYTDIEREGERSETYFIEFTTTEDERYLIETDLTRWQSFALGDQKVIVIDTSGNATLAEE